MKFFENELYNFPKEEKDSSLTSNFIDVEFSKADTSRSTPSEDRQRTGAPETQEELEPVIRRSSRERRPVHRMTSERLGELYLAATNDGNVIL